MAIHCCNLRYMFKAGRIYSGLVVCEFFLADEPLGAGGLAIVLRIAI